MSRNSKRRARFNLGKRHTVTTAGDASIAGATGADCPHPDKYRYLSRREAKAAKNRVVGKVHPYLCVCGFWHTGHHQRAVANGNKTRSEGYDR